MQPLIQHTPELASETVWARRQRRCHARARGSVGVRMCHVSARSAVTGASLPHPHIYSTMFGLVALSFAALAAAAPNMPRATEPDCRTKFAGILSATVTNGNTTTYKSFTLSKSNHTAYLGDGNSPLVVQFQQCDSLNEGEPTDTAVAGRLFVPSKGRCIGITNQPNSKGPYYTTLVKCGTGYSERFGVFFNADNAIYFTGNSDEEGTVLQGGCGTLGYKAASNGVPTITHTEQQITLECNSKPLRLVTAAKK
ncbi:hypothetical protein EXIGLDRAFT_835037 [Exidia glandulosa HHB12029]|uniref:Uncharacterized protein n=1 Tax=Exidia glandulosa HHB12029 TaxID=1314781 RepID=A0A165J4Z5_EXIGL|nr:hypothetical protein EXIGLDRAFT_835037 [Exidia glandulosa HHB12029]